MVALVAMLLSPLGKRKEDGATRSSGSAQTWCRKRKGGVARSSGSAHTSTLVPACVAGSTCGDKVAGFDIGNVLSKKSRGKKPDGDWIYTSAAPGAYACMLLCICCFGASRVCVVSKTDAASWYSWHKTYGKIEHWVVRFLRQLGLFDAGVPAENVRFTRYAAGKLGKGPPIKELGCTHFIDDTCAAGLAAIEEGGADMWIHFDASLEGKAPNNEDVPAHAHSKRVAATDFWSVVVALGLCDFHGVTHDLFLELCECGPPHLPHNDANILWLEGKLRRASSDLHLDELSSSSEANSKSLCRNAKRPPSLINLHVDEPASSTDVDPKLRRRNEKKQRISGAQLDSPPRRRGKQQSSAESERSPLFLHRDDNRFDHRRKHRRIFCDGGCNRLFPPFSTDRNYGREPRINSFDGAYVREAEMRKRYGTVQDSCAKDRYEQMYNDWSNGTLDATWFCLECYVAHDKTGVLSQLTRSEIRFKFNIDNNSDDRMGMNRREQTTHRLA